MWLAVSVAMKISCRRRRKVEQLRSAALAVTLVLSTGLLAATPAAAVTATAIQLAVDTSVAAAARQGIQQSIAVVDRKTGARVAGSGGGTQYISESIVKLFTVAYYEVQAGGRPDDSMAETLRTMIVNSDDNIESSLWNVDIVPSMAARYGLANTSNGPMTGPHDWGWELITADDEAKFLFEMSTDPTVAPLLLEAMAGTARTGADGSNQFFGMNTLPGDHGSKQGWTDIGAGSSEPAEIHSVGWTDQYFVAILQTADGPDFEEMRSSATAAAQAVLAAESPDGAAPDETPTADPTTADSTPTQLTTETNAVPPTTTAAPSAPAAAAPARGRFTDLIAALRQGFDVLVADVTALIDTW